MDFFTHLVIGALVYAIFFKGITWNYLFYAIFFAILPDLDIFLSPLKRKFKSVYLEHRSGSHSYVIGTIASALIGGIYSLFTNQSFLIIWMIGTIFYGIHVSLDLLTTTKIPCFYPFSKKEFCFYAEKAGSSFTLIISLIFLVNIAIVYFNSPNKSTSFLVINIYTYFFLIYYLYRIITKFWIDHHLNEDQKYIPGILPIYFYIFEKKIIDNTLSFSLKKKSHFSRTKLIYKNNSNLTPQEMMLFSRGMELCSEDYYLAKWTAFPEFLRMDGIFSIKFFFLEPMTRLKAMYLQIDFDVDTGQIYSLNQKFGPIKT